MLGPVPGDISLTESSVAVASVVAVSSSVSKTSETSSVHVL